ncbi:ABC transporter ATP-binding protein [Staphylococcus saprophyticus]|uniref:ABC transporter ATP-binding protein n=1 Tax=Staphylococcus TaxID=1279 RepID=UPI000D1A6A26|nr:MULTISPECIES: ABC transporter A family member [Staphylococcus]PTH22304.1 ABC transporter ATP-binding protein [Staphylococcus arlettae]PTH50900.1 ABC transporter ATP-binding protein [Staphylococcus arlettae]PTJ62328.1 ABC transporter ATP-binding protein [Staphylococcus saprophyticus]PTK14169.1 ABC transporter ATP-binding protein [Staphylococcus saprophyticus]
MKGIDIKNLTKKYKNRTAVDTLNLTIKEGEFFALLGTNGAGKTTTIKMLSCLLEPTSGDAQLLGNSIVKNPKSVKKIINVSPQETAIATKLSVKENLELIARIYGISNQEATKKAEEMLSVFGLTKRAKDRANSLSGGMQRKLSLAMSLITNPKILFLDEPTIGLDVRARRNLWKIISELKGKITIILTTHYLEEADALADRIGIMHQGKMRIVGTTKEIKRETGEGSLEDAFLSFEDEEGE